jgi:hypothetical protein
VLTGLGGLGEHKRAMEVWKVEPVRGSTTDFTHPFAMTIHGNPAHKRFPQIKVQRLRGNPDHVRVSQLWGANVSS